MNTNYHTTSYLFEKINEMENKIKVLEKKVEFQDCVISRLLYKTSSNHLTDIYLDDEDNHIVNIGECESEFDFESTQDFNKLSLDDLSHTELSIPPPPPLIKQRYTFDEFCRKSAIRPFYLEDKMYTVDLDIESGINDSRLPSSKKSMCV